MSEGARIKSLENALAVLMAVPPDRGISVSDLSVATGVSKGAISKIMATFRDYGFSAQDAVSKEYYLGPTLIAKGYQAMHHLDIRKLARPELQYLTDEYHMNSMLMIEQSDQVVVVEILQADIPMQITMKLGECHPYYRGAGPKTLLAYQPKWKQEKIIDAIRFEALTERTISTKEELQQALAKIVECGYCLSHGEIVAGTLAISAPVFGPDDQILASMSISATGKDATEEQVLGMIEDVVACAKRVSGKTGNTSPL